MISDPSNQLNDLHTQAAIQYSAAHQVAEDAKALTEWVALSDDERSQSRAYPWMAAHVAKMDAMVAALTKS
jgi:hypothetical protein